MANELITKNGLNAHGVEVVEGVYAIGPSGNIVLVTPPLKQGFRPATSDDIRAAIAANEARHAEEDKAATAAIAKARAACTSQGEIDRERAEENDERAAEKRAERTKHSSVLGQPNVPDDIFTRHAASVVDVARPDGQGGIHIVSAPLPLKSGQHIATQAELDASAAAEAARKIAEMPANTAPVASPDSPKPESSTPVVVAQPDIDARITPSSSSPATTASLDRAAAATVADIVTETISNPNPGSPALAMFGTPPTTTAVGLDSVIAATAAVIAPTAAPVAAVSPPAPDTTDSAPIATPAPVAPKETTGSSG